MNKIDLNIYPFVEDGDLVIETKLDQQDCPQVRLKLSQLFSDFIDYRRMMHSSEINPNWRPEVVETVALLRYIAREMEIEIDGSTH